MNKLFIPLLMLLATTSFAQTPINPYPKTITVTGSAEMEVIPDEIYVQVDLKEYEKKGSGKSNIETIKRNFLNNIKAIGIPDSLVSIAAYDGFGGNPWLRKKNKAQYLTEAIDEKAGEAVTINEPTEYYQPYYNVMRSNVMMKEQAMTGDMAAADGNPVDFRKMKLKYDVTVVFAV